MSNLQEFLSETGGENPALQAPEAPQGSEPVDTLPPPPEDEASANEPPAHSDDTPPEGLDKRGEAIWREERSRRKELQQQVDKMNDRWAQMMERMQPPPAPAAQPTSTGPAEIEIPDFDEDPIGHLRAKNELLERQLTEFNHAQHAAAAQMQQAQQFNQLRSNVDQQESAFAANTPDYHDAVAYLYEHVGRMTQALGYPPQMVQQAVSQTAMDISVRALQSGKNPAELAYEAARNIGWTGAQPQGEVSTPRRGPPTSLSSVAGKRTTPGAPTWDAISTMEDSEFEQFWAQMEKKASGK